MTISTPPKPEELEISIFGPGRGECVILHLGDNEWCIVDSCRAKPAGDPVALEYLSSLQNRAIEGIKLIVATHWHDDHIGGLHDVLRASQKARFCCSMALKADEFLELVALVPQGLSGRSGLEEFASILAELELRGPVAPAFAIENRRLLHLPSAGRSFPTSVTALSPSDVTIKLALNEIASLLPKAGETQQRIVNRSPNHASVVLWVEAGSIRALLGADLEHTAEARAGWTAVLASYQDNVPGLIFKVPHHGSISSDFAEVWRKMLGENPIAVVTPFSGGRVRLPTDSDLTRLSNRTSRLYCTARAPGRPPAREPAVEKAVRRQVTERRLVQGKPGHVRIRWSAIEKDANPIIEVFNGAFHVNVN